MLRLPPGFTRTYTLFPYTTLFRSPAAFGDRMPRMAILPSGKTNALALDLGVPLDWAVADVVEAAARGQFVRRAPIEIYRDGADQRSEEHTSELQSLMRISYAVYCLKKKIYTRY